VKRGGVGVRYRKLGVLVLLVVVVSSLSLELLSDLFVVGFTTSNPKALGLLWLVLFLVRNNYPDNPSRIPGSRNLNQWMRDGLWFWWSAACCSLCGYP